MPWAEEAEATLAEVTPEEESAEAAASAVQEAPGCIRRAAAHQEVEAVSEAHAAAEAFQEEGIQAPSVTADPLPTVSVVTAAVLSAADQARGLQEDNLLYM